MDQSLKTQLLDAARQHLTHTQSSIANVATELHNSLTRPDNDSIETEEIRMLESAIAKHNQQRLEQLHTLHPSPYFTRCDITFEDDTKKQVYIGKFPYEHAGIISWTAPAAAIRFEDPGIVSYRLPDKTIQSGTLHRKDQYMIAQGQIIFFATEQENVPRELVYQEYLSNRTSGFALPEIVAQMEKAQDEVIRAEARGPLVIAGPAGSGKTTLALHRVAYLTQSPDTASRFTGPSILVFVQDTGTKEYFTHLLPQLGIHHVRIATFSEWALERLALSQTHTYATRIGDSEELRDWYEHAKTEALRHFVPTSLKPGKEYEYLERAYGSYLDNEQRTWLGRQRSEHTLDRLDITILLLGLWRANPGFAAAKEFSVTLKDGRLKREVRQIPLRCSLIVVDEFQNYLPEQLRILQDCMNPKYGSVLYVGDMAQQTSFGTVRDWNDVDTTAQHKIVRLQKVYRNTRQILEYVRSRGFEIEIPEGIKDGPAVTEQTVYSNAEVIAFIEQTHTRMEGGRVGVLARHASDLEDYREHFTHRQSVYVMSMRESQGVEFDAVIILENTLDQERPLYNRPERFKEEQARINRDLQYVALTRAISELHILKR